jgi:putative ABC transport system permease protein
MFRLNLKLALRSLWKNKSYAFINILGLAVALCLFLFAILYVNREKSFDRWSTGVGLTYRINTKQSDKSVALTPGNVAMIAKEKIAAVSASTRMQGAWIGDLLIKTKDKTLYCSNFLMADSNFFEVFPYPALYGDPKTALAQPQSVILSKAYSDVLFGVGVDPTGESVAIDKNQGYTVKAVIDTKRYPSHFSFDMITRLDGNGAGEYYSNNYYTYVRLSSDANLSATQNLLNKERNEVSKGFLGQLSKDDQLMFAERIKTNSLKLQAIGDIHLNKADLIYEFADNGVGKYLQIMLIIAALILIIAAVNFSNLSVTMTLQRAKETGIRKVLGAQRHQIVVQFLLETTVQCMLSLIIGLGLLELISPQFNTLINTQVGFKDIENYGQVIFQIVGLLAFVIAFVGAYPALLISNTVPSLVLKGNFSTTEKGYLVRNALIIFQFATSVLFLSGIWIIHSQLEYMQTKDLGYKPSQVIAINLMNSDDKYFDKLKSVLAEVPGIKGISRTDRVPGENMGGNNYISKSVTYASDFITVDVGYFQTMGMDILMGEAFKADNIEKNYRSVLLTEAAAKKLNLNEPVGKTLKLGGQDLEVIGLVKDFNHYSPEKDYQPIVFQYLNGNLLHYLLVQVDAANASNTLQRIENVWKTFEPESPLKASFMDQAFERLLATQIRLQKLIGILSGVAIGLALMGLFAIAAFTIQKRNREISIRKVLGASLMDILTLLNRVFIKLVVVANVIAWPIAYIVLNDWLNDFAFRTELSVWPFIVSGAISLLLTIVVVSLQAFKTANANPSNNLKYD